MHFPLSSTTGETCLLKEFEKFARKSSISSVGVSWINNVREIGVTECDCHDNHLMLWVDVPDTDSNLRLMNEISNDGGSVFGQDELYARDWEVQVT